MLPVLQRSRHLSHARLPHSRPRHAPALGISGKTGMTEGGRRAGTYSGSRRWMRRFPALARDPGITHLCTNTGRRGGGAFSKGTIPAGSAGKLPALTGIIPQPAMPRFLGRERIRARPRKKKAPK